MFCLFQDDGSTTTSTEGTTTGKRLIIDVYCVIILKFLLRYIASRHLEIGLWSFKCLKYTISTENFLLFSMLLKPIDVGSSVSTTPTPSPTVSTTEISTISTTSVTGMKIIVV